MNQEGSLIFNVYSASELDSKPSAKLINTSSSAKILTPSSTQFIISNSARYLHSLHAIPNKHLPAKYTRRGDKLYRADSEHIHMLQNKNKRSSGEKERQKSSIQTHTVDKVHSGESLYKTFSFEQSSSSDDTDKCIAFWRSVMEKNLAPIKCSIIEQVESSEQSATQLESDSGTSLNAEVARLHEDYKKMVQSVLRDLQKKRLHEIKMYGARCKLCEAISSSLDVDSDQKMSTSDVEKDNILRELDEWTPQSKKKVLPAPPQHSQVKERACPCSESKQSIDTYQLHDVIDEKTKSGAYTAWRRNTLDPCPCGNLNCDCNTNPAIVSIKIQPGSSGSISGSPSETTSSSQEGSSSSEGFSDSNGEVTFLGHQISSIKESVSFVTHCQCGIPDCICHSEQITFSKNKITEVESYQIIKPNTVSNVTMEMSYAVSRETIRETPRPITVNETNETNEKSVKKEQTCAHCQSPQAHDDCVSKNA